MAKFSIIERLQSFKHAFNGLKLMLKDEHNFRVHLFAAIGALVLGFVLKISSLEWGVLIGIIGAVFTAEIFNSSLENLADAVTKEHNEAIKKAKDLAAAAVLVMALSAFVIGCVIFAPKIIDALN